MYGHTDLEPHNQPDPLTHTHDHATTPETTEPCGRLKGDQTPTAQPQIQCTMYRNWRTLARP